MNSTENGKVEQPKTDDYPKPQLTDIYELSELFPEETEPLINGLLRRGETANIIASPKMGKSWLSLGLAFSVATGREWLGHDVTCGKVLLLDNELRRPTIAKRSRTVARAMGITREEVGGRLMVESLRGRLTPLRSMEFYFRDIADQGVDLIVIDAWYRLIAPGDSENDNAAMALMYNQLDRHAEMLNCAFVCIHHSSKGDQSNKSVTDVGAGAGSQSRAVDDHIILRPHELGDGDMAVMEARPRSFPTPKPLSLKWEFPLWLHKPGIDANVMRPKTRGDKRQDEKDADGEKLIFDVIANTRASHNRIREQTGFGKQRVDRLIRILKDKHLIDEHEAQDGEKNGRYFTKATPPT